MQPPVKCGHADIKGWSSWAVRTITFPATGEKNYLNSRSRVNALSPERDLPIITWLQSVCSDLENLMMLSFLFWLGSLKGQTYLSPGLIIRLSDEALTAASRFCLWKRDEDCFFTFRLAPGEWCKIWLEMMTGPEMTENWLNSSISLAARQGEYLNNEALKHNLPLCLFRKRNSW